MTTTTPVQTTSREEIAANVRVALARRQLDQRVVAEALGKSQAAISDRMRGTTHFRVDELQIIAALAEVPFADLIAPAPAVDA